MGAMFVYAIVYMLNGCRQATMDMSEYQYSIDNYYFHFALLIGFFCTLFSSMFFGTEFSDGTIRNKIIVGHTRENIYLASLITTFTATLVIMSVWLVSALVAVPTLGFWKIGVFRLFLFLLISVMFVLAYSAIFTVINMLSSNKALTVLISILLFLGLLVFASVIYNSLSEPETVSGVLINKATGEPFTLNGEEIRSDVTFTPETADGEVTVTFTFNADGITKETEVVVFETLYREGVEIAVHADIEDDGQTVKLTPPTPDVPQTGDNSNLGFWIGLGAIALGGLISVGIMALKKKKDDDDE